MSLGTSVNKHKNGILLAYIADKIPDIHLRKMLKIIYLMDEHFMTTRGFPLTWFDYYAWAKGPVAPEVYAVKEGAFSEFVTAAQDADGKNILTSRQSYDMGVFSKTELTAIDMLLSEYKGKSADELSDMTHEPQSLWSKTVARNNIMFDDSNRRSDFPIHLTELFSMGDPRIDTYLDAKLEMELQKYLDDNRNPYHKIQLNVVTASEREKYRIPAYNHAIP